MWEAAGAAVLGLHLPNGKKKSVGGLSVRACGDVADHAWKLAGDKDEGPYLVPNDNSDRSTPEFFHLSPYDILERNQKAGQMGIKACINFRAHFVW